MCYVRVLFDAKARGSRAGRSVSKQDVSPIKELPGFGDRNGGGHPLPSLEQDGSTGEILIETEEGRAHPP